MLTAHDAASYFLSLSTGEAGDYISNLKLQKLCYYAQGLHLALYDEPLFEDPIEAWQYGPVIPSLYQTYKAQGDKGIDPTSIDKDNYPPRVQEVIEDIYETYGQFSAWKLCTLTHQEPPWLEVYGMGDGVISLETMRRYFKTLLLPSVKNNPLRSECF
jgi:uncharacterized phage-associated protein